MKYLIFFMLLLSVVSCKTPHIFTNTVTETKWRDTTVYVEKLIPVDRIIEVPIPGHTDTLVIRENIYVSGGQATMKSIHVQKGIIAVDASIYKNEFSVDAYLTDSTIIYRDKYTLTYADSVTIHDAIASTTTVKTITLPPEKYVPPFYKKLLWFNILCLIAIAGIIAWRIKGAAIRQILSKLK